jgi:FtsH ternary system domain X6
MTAATPPAVSRFEANLITLARFVVGAVPAEQARRPLADGFAPPPCLSAACVRLVQDTLAKGLTLTLVRAGGWRTDEFLTPAGPTAGRVWERHPVTSRRLSFGPAVLSFLMWLTAEKGGEPKHGWEPPADDPTAADELFFARAADALRGETAGFSAVKSRSAFARNPLARLFRPADYPGVPPPDFAPTVRGDRAVLLECLQPALADRWTRAERQKVLTTDWSALRDQGAAEYATLTAFLAAADAAGRRDLARFAVVATGRTLAAPDRTPAHWLGGLAGGGPPRLADRLDVQRTALSLHRAADVLADWDRRARTVGYFDDDYPAAQMWNREWEANRGADAARTARRLLDALDPLRVQTTTG